MYQLLQTERFESWLHGVRDGRVRGRINAHLARIRAHGPYCGDWKRVGSGVVEQRIHVGPGYRVYLTTDGDRVVVLLIGGDKSSQKRDIVAAQRMVHEWKGSAS